MSANPGALPGWFNRRPEKNRTQKEDPSASPRQPEDVNPGAASDGENTAESPTTHAVTGGGKEDQTPVVVWEAANRMEAEIVAGRLRSEGIPAIIRGEALGTIYGLTTGSLAASTVLVPAALAEKAF